MIMTRLPVTFHVSLSPGDLPYAKYLLPHQLRAFAPHVSEIVLTVDGGPEGTPDLSPFQELANPFLDSCPAWNIRMADHSESNRRSLARSLFGLEHAVPHRTYRRGPSLSYYDGWAAATQPFLFHTDSDMFYGGDIGAWLSSSLELFAADPKVFSCNPLAGPPRPDGTLNQSDLGPHPSAAGSHKFAGFSTRLFLVRRIDVVSPVPPLTWRPAILRNRVRALIDGLPTLDLPENLLSHRMLLRDEIRVDHPGPGSPAFSLHPPHRNADFYARLPELVTRAETDDYPDGQRGCYDVNATLIDWSPQIAALSQRRWWHALIARITGSG